VLQHKKGIIIVLRDPSSHATPSLPTNYKGSPGAHFPTTQAAFQQPMKHSYSKGL